MQLIRITTVPISLKLLITGQPRYMAENGLDVIMMSADGPEIKEVITNEKCIHIILPLTRQISPFNDLKSLYILYKYLIKTKPSIVHTHTPKAGLIGMLASRFAKVPLRLHTIAGLPLMTSKGLKRRILILTEKLTSWGAHKVLPNSKSIYKYMYDNNLAPPNKLDIIGEGSSNGIDLDRFSISQLDSNKIEELKNQLNTKDKITIISVGRMVKDKGIIELVKAFEANLKNIKNLQLLLLGPFENERTSEYLPDSIIESIKNNESIVHINWSDEVEYYMAISDILVHASHREGFPNVVLQAGAMNLPIICSNIPGNNDIVTDVQKGTLFEVNNSFDLEVKLKQVINNLDSAKEKSSQLRKYIEENFEQKKIHKLILNYYKKHLPYAD